jgi:hypothetical protein
MLLFASFAAGLVSCAPDGEKDKGSDSLTEVRFTAGIESLKTRLNGEATRTSADGNSWVAGDAIGIYMLTADGGLMVENAKYIATPGQDPTTASFAPASAAETLYYSQTGEFYFVAYYPYCPTDQFERPGHILFDLADHVDFMWSWPDMPANWNAYSKGETVEFIFSHALSRVSFDITLGEGMEGLTGADVESVTLGNILREALLAIFYPGSFPSINFGDFDARRIATRTGADATFTALVVPDDGRDMEEATITFNVGGELRTAGFPGGESFEPGEHYIYPVTIDGTQIKFGSPDIAPWEGTDDAPIEGGVEDLLDSGVDGNIFWRITADGTLIISGTGAMPSYSVIERPWEEYVDRVKKVIVEEGVTSVGYSAFINFASLESVRLAQSVTKVGNSAFWACVSLTEVDLGGVKEIESDAFESCPRLVDIDLSGVTVIGDEAFFNSEDLTAVDLSSIRTLGFFAFYNCLGLESVTIGKDVESMPDGAFGYCLKLEEVTVLATSPPEIHPDCFERDPYFPDKADVLYVPAGSYNTYVSSPWADQFDSIDAFYAVGDIYPHSGTPIGVVFEVSANGRNGNIVSLDEARGVPWGTYNVRENTVTSNGCENMRIIGLKGGNFANYPAFKWCHDRNPAGTTYSQWKPGVWYLPTEEELNVLFRAKATVIEGLRRIANSDRFEHSTTIYWSSQQASQTGDAMVYDHRQMKSGPEKKNLQNRPVNVRAVMSF